jgi:hypothetical protein
MIQEKQRMGIIRAIGKAKSFEEEEEIIEELIRTAFEEGRIIEAEYYRLYYQRMMVDRLDDIKASLEYEQKKG